METKIIHKTVLNSPLEKGSRTIDLAEHPGENTVVVIDNEYIWLSDPVVRGVCQTEEVDHDAGATVWVAGIAE